MGLTKTATEKWSKASLGYYRGLKDTTKAVYCCTRALNLLVKKDDLDTAKNLLEAVTTIPPVSEDEEISVEYIIGGMVKGEIDEEYLESKLLDNLKDETGFIKGIKGFIEDVTNLPTLMPPGMGTLPQIKVLDSNVLGVYEKSDIFNYIKEVVIGNTSCNKVEVTDKTPYIESDLSGTLYIPYTVLNNLDWLKKFLPEEEFKSRMIDMARHENAHRKSHRGSVSYQEIADAVTALDEETVKKIAGRYGIREDEVIKRIQEYQANAQAMLEYETAGDFLDSVAALSEFMLLAYYGRDGFNREVSRDYLEFNYRAVKEERLNGVLEASKELHEVHRERFNLLEQKVSDLTRYFFNGFDGNTLAILLQTNMLLENIEPNKDIVDRARLGIKHKYEGVSKDVGFLFDVPEGLKIENELDENSVLESLQGIFEGNKLSIPKKIKTVDGGWDLFDGSWRKVYFIRERNGKLKAYDADYQPLYVIKNKLLPELEERVNIFLNAETEKEGRIDAAKKIKEIIEKIREEGSRYAHETVNGYHLQLTGKYINELGVVRRALLEYRSYGQILKQAIWLKEKGIDPNEFERLAMDYYGILGVKVFDNPRDAMDFGGSKPLMKDSMVPLNVELILYEKYNAVTGVVVELPGIEDWLNAQDIKFSVEKGVYHIPKTYYDGDERVKFPKDWKVGSRLNVESNTLSEDEINPQDGEAKTIGYSRDVINKVNALLVENPELYEPLMKLTQPIKDSLDVVNEFRAQGVNIKLDSKEVINALVKDRDIEVKTTFKDIKEGEMVPVLVVDHKGVIHVCGEAPLYLV